MTKRESDIENQKALLKSIRSDVSQASNELTKLYEDEALIKERIVEAQEHLESIQYAVQKELAHLGAEQKALKHAEQDFERNKKRLIAETETVKQQRTRALNELTKTNEWILTAEHNRDNLEETLKAQRAELREQKAIQAETKKLRSKLKVIKEEITQELLDIKLKRDDFELKQHNALASVKQAQKELEALAKQRQREEEALTTALNERTRIEKDLQIYIERVEKHYQKAFPELKMKL